MRRGTCDKFSDAPWLRYPPVIVMVQWTTELLKKIVLKNIRLSVDKGAPQKDSVEKSLRSAASMIGGRVNGVTGEALGTSRFFGALEPEGAPSCVVPTLNQP